MVGLSDIGELEFVSQYYSDLRFVKAYVVVDTDMDKELVRYYDDIGFGMWVDIHCGVPTLNELRREWLLKW